MVQILDTTLRDGEQTPGVNFRLAEKIAIAQQLDLVGVDWIEVGTPAMGREEKQAIAEILQLNLTSQIVTWNRALAKDLEHSLEIGSKWLHLSLPVSKQMVQGKLKTDYRGVIAQLKEAVSLLKNQGVKFSVGAEDASRAEPEFLQDYAQAAKDLGAQRLRLCDTVGILDPFSLIEKFGPLVKSIGLPCEIHNHDDYGMATANSLAAIKAGFEVVDTTVLGLGERAGNAALEEIALIISGLLGQPSQIKTPLLLPLAHLVATAAGRVIPQGKSIVGEKIFYHESGIHVDGVIKDPANYEPYAPELVGATRHILLGKHSSRKAILYKLTQLGILPKGNPTHLVERIFRLANQKKGGLADRDLRHLARL